jgi:DNA-binding SARP family transcriptional activator
MTVSGNLKNAGFEHHVTEVSMLGALEVQRIDGLVVDPRAWRTGKTADLVRLLALGAGQPVATHTLLSVLWPKSDQPHGRASLRTAVAQVRHVLGRDCVERSLGGLRLHDTWVDVVAFRGLAADVRRMMSSTDLSSVEAIAREADALYRGDLRAHDDSADWVQVERRSLADTRQILLCDAADATLACGNAQDAIDFATRALALDPFCERACRVLMRGFAEIGESSRALREYECRRVLLAEELGVDPSPQTRALHLELLRVDHPTPAA